MSIFIIYTESCSNNERTNANTQTHPTKYPRERIFIVNGIEGKGDGLKSKCKSKYEPHHTLKMEPLEKEHQTRMSSKKSTHFDEWQKNANVPKCKQHIDKWKMLNVL